MKNRAIREKVKYVRVRALKDSVKRDIVHWPTGFKFNEEGIALWPLDTFTQRRVRDRDVAIVAEVEPPEGQAAQPQIEAPRARRRTVEPSGSA
jgi:hypothetical protein